MADELDPAQLDAVLTGALDDTAAAGIFVATVTPFVLARIADVTAGRSIPADLALVAAEVACAISRFEPKSRPDAAVTSRQ